MNVGDRFITLVGNNIVEATVIRNNYDYEAHNVDYVNAKREEVKIFTDSGGNTFATSVSQPGKLYAVDKYGCECLGYENRRHCKHYALWLSEQNKNTR